MYDFIKDRSLKNTLYESRKIDKCIYFFIYITLNTQSVLSIIIVWY